MKNMIKIFVFIFIMLSAFTSLCQTTEIKCNPISTFINGTYHSKNLYLQQTEVNGIQSILINNVEIKLDRSKEAFEIDLSALPNGQTFEIKIIYCDTLLSPYKILNPEAIK